MSELIFLVVVILFLLATLGLIAVCRRLMEP
jgi:hypothetical protein